MKRLTRFATSSAKELWSLLVDDGFLAVVALIAIAVAYLLSRDAVLGAVDAVGWILIGLLVGSMVVSVRRAIAAHQSAWNEDCVATDRPYSQEHEEKT